MILVDTSVVLDYIRTANAPLGSLFRSLPVALCGVTRAELLHGARTAADRQNLLTFMAAFQPIVFQDAWWDAVGDNLSALRTAGVAVPFADAILATVALECDLEFWTRDQQFRRIQQVIPRLRLFQEPP